MGVHAHAATPAGGLLRVRLPELGTRLPGKIWGGQPRWLPEAAQLLWGGPVSEASC